MLINLEIKNGEMSLEFDPLNTIYTISVTSDVKALELDYELAESSRIEIIGNTLKEGVNEVVLNVSNDKEEIKYTLYVYKEKVKTASSNITEVVPVELPREEMPYYVPAGIAGVCFLVILFTFTLLFKKRKRN